MTHLAKALVITCIDFRFQKKIRDFLIQKGYDNNFDLISLAGAAKNLADPTNIFDKQSLLKQITLSKNLHHVSEVFFVNHQDCGAYGLKASQDSKNELNIHRKDLFKAKRIVNQLFPELKVYLYYLTLKKEFVNIVAKTLNIPKTNWSSLLGNLSQASTLGMTIALPPVIAVFFGLFLDKLINTTPIFTIIFILLGLLIGIFSAVKEVKRFTHQ